MNKNTNVYILNVQKLKPTVSSHLWPCQRDTCKGAQSWHRLLE